MNKFSPLVRLLIFICCTRISERKMEALRICRIASLGYEQKCHVCFLGQNFNQFYTMFPGKHVQSKIDTNLTNYMNQLYFCFACKQGIRMKTNSLTNSQIPE